jgi:hypothetical protein
MDMAIIMSELEDDLRKVANEHGGTVDVVRAEAAEVLPFKPLPSPDGADCIIEGEFSETEPIPEGDFPEDIVFSDGTVLDDA